MKERISELCKLLRKESSAVSTKKLMALDWSDRRLLETQLESVIDQLLRIQTIADARCSVVLEMYEYMGGKIPTVKETFNET